MHWQLGSGTRIIIGDGAVRPVERAAAYLQAQVQKRTGWLWPIVQGVEPRPGDIALGIPGDGTTLAPMQPQAPEEIVLWCGGDPSQPVVFALAGGPSVAMAVAGKLARTMDLRPGCAALPALSLREHPAYPVRGHTFANHKQNNTYDKWSYAQWEEYLTEMAAWGDNIAIVYPLHSVRWPGCLPFEDMPWFDTPEKESEFYRQLEIQLKLPALCHELGMRYGIWMPVNDIFPEEVVRDPDLTRHGGPFVCPHIPKARQRIRAFRDRLFALLPAVDVIFFPSRDDGGCPGCEACTPWGPVYEELVKEQTAQMHRYHPECKVWLAQQGLSARETTHLLHWLETERPHWVEGVVFGPFGEVMTFADPFDEQSDLSLEHYGRSGPDSGPVNRLRAALPGDYRVILYPDETHTFRAQYPVLAMDPVLQYVWGREDAPSPRPREMAAIHAATCPAADGAVPYSEGNTDDVNKFIWSSGCWAPEKSADTVVGEYARWFFGREVAEQAAELIFKLEEALSQAPYANPTIKSARALAEACEARAPQLMDNWRWLSLRLAALMLDYVRQVVERDRRLAAKVRYRVALWRSWPDPVPGLRKAIAYYEQQFAQTDGLLREIVWTRDRLFALQKLAVRGVARLQTSYMKLDVMVEQYKEYLARLERGEAQPFPANREHMLAPREIFGPMGLVEECLRQAVRGVQVVDDLQEYPGQKGRLTW